MDKMEILKLALAHAPDPKSAMELAREMEAFLKGPDPAPRWVVETVKGMAHPQPEVSVKLKKKRRSWDEYELRSLEGFMAHNYEIDYMANIMGRSRDSIKSAIMRLKSGEYKIPPTISEQINAGRFLGHTS